MSEETDALSNRIRQLESQVADMQRLVQDTSDLLDIARANGLDKFLTGHGLMEYGGGVDRLDTTGIQIKTQATGTKAIWFSDSFVTDPSAVAPQAWVSGSSGGTDGQIQSRAYDDSNNYAQLELSSSPTISTWNATLFVTALLSGTFYVLTLGPYVTTTDYYFKADGGPIRLNNASSAYTGTARTGFLQFRSDTSKYEVYDGAWENLATESYVAANAPTGFADAFLVMGG